MSSFKIPRRLASPRWKKKWTSRDVDINKDPSKMHAEKKRKIQLKFCKTCPKELLGQKVTQRKQSLILTNSRLISWFSLGRHFDKDGNLNNWWSPRSFFGFNTRAICLAKQYSQFEVYGQKVYFSGILPPISMFPTKSWDSLLHHAFVCFVSLSCKSPI